jgi:protein STE50
MTTGKTTQCLSATGTPVRPRFLISRFCLLPDLCHTFPERCLSYDEKPLLLFQRLKEAKKNPVFMLKHIRDIRSPIAVAQQKQAARTKDKERQAQINSNEIAPAFSKTSAGAAARAAGGSGPLVVDGRSTGLATGNLTTSNPWPDVMSPITAHTDHNSAHADVNGRGLISPQSDNTHGPSHALAAHSYAVAIYPYTAEREDEFDVSVNDTFIISQRAKGWWVVQKDPTGTGHADNDGGRQGWVPAGCLLETNLPVTLAIQEANASRPSDHYSRDPDRMPILPTSIVSTSYPGIALMDYRRKGEEELDLVKDDALRVFKRYNHWSYVSVVLSLSDIFGTDKLCRPSRRSAVTEAGFPPGLSERLVPAAVVFLPLQPHIIRHL